MAKKRKTMREVMEMANEDYANDKDQPMKPYDINNGFCNDWAQMVMDNLEDIAPTEMWETVCDYAEAIHCFIRINGKFYDAECLDGVDDHMQLPLFINNKYTERQAVWLIDHNKLVPNDGRETSRDITPEEIAEYNRRNFIT